MRQQIVFALFLVAAVLSGCGDQGARPAILEVLKGSPYTYFAYTDQRWWGRTVQVRASQVGVVGNLAAATVEVRSRGQLVARQSFMLQRGRTWHLVPPRYVAGFASECKTARLSIAKFVNCQLRPDVKPASAFGPRERRKPTLKERRALVRGETRRLARTHRTCDRLSIWVSRVNDRFAVVEDSCRTIESQFPTLYLFAGRRWVNTHIDLDPIECGDAPPGVMRSLFGGCLL